MEPVLKVTGISKRFKEHRALDNISFEMYEGEILGLLGPNGAGKSTMIRTIMGIMLPDEGEIRFSIGGGTNVLRHHIGYLPEERGLYRNAKVLDILLYFARLKDYPVDRAKARAFNYLEKFDLKGKEKAKIEELSKGMAQKVQFIASVIHEPSFLILDEPFSGLDPVSQDLFKAEIRHLREQGTAILLSSHQMNLVEELCDRLFMIYRGKKVIYGDVQHIKETYADFKCDIIGDNPRVEFKELPGVKRVVSEENKVTLYLANDTNPVSVLRLLPDYLHIQEMHVDRISLHDIFVSIAKGDVSREDDVAR